MLAYTPVSREQWAANILFHPSLPPPSRTEWCPVFSFVLGWAPPLRWVWSGRLLVRQPTQATWLVGIRYIGGCIILKVPGQERLLCSRLSTQNLSPLFIWKVGSTFVVSHCISFSTSTTNYSSPVALSFHGDKISLDAHDTHMHYTHIRVCTLSRSYWATAHGFCC